MYIFTFIKDGFKDTYYDSSKNLTSFKKIKMVFYSLLLTFCIASIFILMKGENPLVIFQLIWKGATTTKSQMNQTLLNTAMFIAVGIGIIISFKAGLFNVGITGQLYLGGSVALLVGVTTHIHWVFLLLIAILAAMLLGAIGGVLRAFFNIHEVVATILLNWVAYYFVRYLFRTGQSFMGTTSSNYLSGDSIMQIAGSSWQPAIIIALILLFTYWFIIKKTSLGYSFNAIGLNKDASKYAGMNIKAKIILALTLSSIGAGILGAIMFLGRDKVYSIPTTISLPGEGFEGVAVALIAFNSPIGLIPVAFIWAILKIGSDQVPIFSEVPKELIQLISGLIMYSVAISTLFLRFKPVSSLKRGYYYWKNEKIIHERNKYRKALSVQKVNFIKVKNRFSNIDFKVKSQIILEYNRQTKFLQDKINKILNKNICLKDKLIYYLFVFIYSIIPIKYFKITQKSLDDISQEKLIVLINKKNDLEKFKNNKLEEIYLKSKKNFVKEYKNDKKILKKEFISRKNRIFNSFKPNFLFTSYKKSRINYKIYQEKKKKIEIDFMLKKIEMDQNIKNNKQNKNIWNDLKIKRNEIINEKKDRIISNNLNWKKMKGVT